MLSFINPRSPGGVRWWHLHASAVLIAVVAFVIAFAAGAFTTVGVQHYLRMTQLRSTGYKPGPLPPLTKAVGGATLPNYFSLEKYSVRIHNQGASFSCVGQTIATQVEITECQRFRRSHPRQHACPYLPMSSGFIWNALNGGNFYRGINYQDAYNRLLSVGEAPLRDFYPDGYNAWWVYPGYVSSAYQYHASVYRQIAPGDIFTMRQMLHAGYTLGIAMPWYYSLANAYGVSFVPAQYGNYMYDHSVTGVGYTPYGLLIQNSFGPAWGINGRTVLAWRVLTNANASIIVAFPAHDLPPFRTITRPAPFNRALWCSWRKAHGKPCVAARDPKTHRLNWPAAIFTKHQRLGGIKNLGRWYGPTAHRRYGFMRFPFLNGAVFAWPHYHSYTIQWWHR